MRVRRSRLVLAICAAALTLSACALGPRPTLQPVTTIDDNGAQRVLSRLERANALDFTAEYDIIPSTTGTTTKAQVVQQDGRRRITIGNVVFSSDGNSAQTCQNDLEGCSDFLDDARISDLNITHLFWGPALASRLGIDANRRIGPSTEYATSIAGRRAICVDVILPSVATTTGTVTYCALRAGVLARYFGADVSIELTSFEPGTVPADFEG